MDDLLSGLWGAITHNTWPRRMIFALLLALMIYAWGITQPVLTFWAISFAFAEFSAWRSSKRG